MLFKNNWMNYISKVKTQNSGNCYWHIAKHSKQRTVLSYIKSAYDILITQDYTITAKTPNRSRLKTWLISLS